MLVKATAVVFLGAIVAGLPNLATTDQCREQGRRNPNTGKYEVVCPTHLQCDEGAQCTKVEFDWVGEGGVRYKSVKCVCPGEIPAPKPCDAVASYRYYTGDDGETWYVIEWVCEGAPLCDPPRAECDALPPEGWITVPFYLCDC